MSQTYKKADGDWGVETKSKWQIFVVHLLSLVRSTPLLNWLFPLVIIPAGSWMMGEFWADSSESSWDLLFMTWLALNLSTPSRKLEVGLEALFEMLPLPVPDPTRRLVDVVLLLSSLALGGLVLLLLSQVLMSAEQSFMARGGYILVVVGSLGRCTPYVLNLPSPSQIKDRWGLSKDMLGRVAFSASIFLITGEGGEISFLHFNLYLAAMGMVIIPGVTHLLRVIKGSTEERGRVSLKGSGDLRPYRAYSPPGARLKSDVVSGSLKGLGALFAKVVGASVALVLAHYVFTLLGNDPGGNSKFMAQVGSSMGGLVLPMLCLYHILRHPQPLGAAQASSGTIESALNARFSGPEAHLPVGAKALRRARGWGVLTRWGVTSALCLPVLWWGDFLGEGVPYALGILCVLLSLQMAPFRVMADSKYVSLRAVAWLCVIVATALPWSYLGVGWRIVPFWTGYWSVGWGLIAVSIMAATIAAWGERRAPQPRVTAG